MNRRVAWTTGVVVAVVIVAGAVVWWSSASGPDAARPSVQTAAPTPTADAQTLAQRELDDHLEECAADEAVDGIVPEGCGIRIPWGTEFATVESVDFRVERLPTLEMVDDGFVAEGGILVATVTGVGQDGSRRTETYRTESWSVRGDVTITDEEVKLDVW